MRTDVTPEMTAAAVANIRTPYISVYLYNAVRPSPVLDLSPYIQQATITLPPTMKPGILQLTCVNPGGVISLSPLFKADYEASVYLGYVTPHGLRRVRVGRFWLDTPQRTLDTTVSKPTDVVTIQGRDGYKLLMERHFELDELVDLGSLPMRDAILRIASLVQIGTASLQVNFDTDAETQFALDQAVVQPTGSPTDTSKTAFDLLKDTIGTFRFLCHFDHNGELSVGLKNTKGPPVAVFGGVLGLERPIYYRSMRRSSLETYNVVHVDGNLISAEVRDDATIADIGRRKYKYISDPTLDTVEQALVRAHQELDLAVRFREQPDIQCPWLPELQRRDVIEINDQQAIHLPRGFYRIEDTRYDYTAGTAPKVFQELGLGIIGVESASETTASAFGTGVTG